MAELLTTLKQANRNLHFGKAVVERRAEMEAQCECLADWVEGRECICGDKAVSVPLSTENLKKAHEIVKQIEDCDRRITAVTKSEHDNLVCTVHPDKAHRQYDHEFGHVTFCNNRGQHVYAPEVTLPRAVLLAALNDERLRLMIELQRTGIASVDSPNIRAIPR